MASTLPPAARAAWIAYQAMGITKERHFEYLQHLELKYQKYGRPSPGEEARLAELLAQHDLQVSAFRAALQELKTSDPGAHTALVDRLAQEGGGVAHH